MGKYKGFAGAGMNQSRNVSNVVKQAQKMQEEMDEARRELAEKEYEIKAGGGAVTLVITGEKVVKSLDISEEIVDPDDIETLSDILIAAFNEAVKQVDSDSESRMSQITNSLNIPSIPGLPGAFGGLG